MISVSSLVGLLAPSVRSSVSSPPTAAVAASAAASAASSAAASSGTASETDFLTLLTAEMQNQDPTAPVDPTEFASQLAQFATLGQLQTISQEVQPSPLAGLSQAASFIGQQVVAPGNAIGVSGGKATSIVYTPTAADNYTAQIYNAQGAQVGSVSLGQLGAGTLQTFTWQPPTSIADGSYTVQIVGSSAGALSGLLEQGVVQNVTMSSSGINLNLGNLVVPGSSVTQVAQP
ncbi:MAG: hypothetical protein M1336_03705 [Deltaproteobacteria bacterium]|jgi:flagellar basal-body rod modification protein FlgD|nr:hypothetical protein [Deltaproteobacteria bacterium]